MKVAKVIYHGAVNGHEKVLCGTTTSGVSAQMSCNVAKKPWLNHNLIQYFSPTGRRSMCSAVVVFS